MAPYLNDSCLIEWFNICLFRFKKCIIFSCGSAGPGILWNVENQWMASLWIHFAWMPTNECLWRSIQLGDIKEGLGQDTGVDWSPCGHCRETFRRQGSGVPLWNWLMFCLKESESNNSDMLFIRRLLFIG